MPENEINEVLRVAEFIVRPLPAGVETIPNPSCYLKPEGQSELFGVGLLKPEAPLQVCAMGRAVLGLTNSKEEALEVVQEWLNRGEGLFWFQHATRYFKVSEVTCVKIGVLFSQTENFEEVADILRENPQDFV